MSTIVGCRPPPATGREERPEWIELVRLVSAAEIDHLLDRLELDGIESRLEGDEQEGVVLVRRLELEPARFVLVRIAYESPAAPEPRRRTRGLLRRAAIALAGAALAAALIGPLLASGPAEADSCRARGTPALRICEPAPGR